MNKVFISGIIEDEPSFVQSPGGAAHLIFRLCVRHRTKKDMVKRELYCVNAWNGPAQWGGKNLRQGQSVGIQGYLTQHVRENGMLTVEITAEEFLPGSRMTAWAQAMPPQPVPSRAEKKPATADVMTADTEVASEDEAAS